MPESNHIEIARKAMSSLCLEDVVDLFADYILQMQMDIHNDFVNEEMDERGIPTCADIVESAQAISDDIINGEFSGETLKEVIQRVAARRQIIMKVEYKFKS